ncbi:unnamed protein product, partial [Thlaspi arvense]
REIMKPTVAAMAVRSHGGDCCKNGPGNYTTPLLAMFGPREKLIYVAVIYTGTGQDKPDYLATVDVDSSSSTYSSVIHRLSMPYLGDELHHSGWNSCSSCYSDPSCERRYLILPSRLLGEDEIGLSASTLLLSFLCLVLATKMKTQEDKEGSSPLFEYDFWYQPRHETMISTSWGAPAAWPEGQLTQILDLDVTRLLSLEVRFLHDPTKAIGFVGCALSSTIVRFFKNEDETYGAT